MTQHAPHANQLAALAEIATRARSLQDRLADGQQSREDSPHLQNGRNRPPAETPACSSACWSGTACPASGPRPQSTFRSPPRTRGLCHAGWGRCKRPTGGQAAIRPRPPWERRTKDGTPPTRAASPLSRSRRCCSRWCTSPAPACNGSWARATVTCASAPTRALNEPCWSNSPRSAAAPSWSGSRCSGSATSRTRPRGRPAAPTDVCTWHS